MPEVKETCSCGADFKISDTELEDALKALKSWRRTHKCYQSGLTEMGEINSSNSMIERVEDITIPELHIGFRANPSEDGDE